MSDRTTEDKGADSMNTIPRTVLRPVSANLAQKIQGVLGVSHLLVDLGWVDFDLGVPPSCPAASAKFPSAQADLVRQWNTQNAIQPNPSQPSPRADGTLYTVTNLMIFGPI